MIQFVYNTGHPNYQYFKPYLYRHGGASGNSGVIFVTSPIPFVRPSRNSSRDPMLMYSGRLKNRNMTMAFSFVWIPLYQVTTTHHMAISWCYLAGSVCNVLSTMTLVNTAVCYSYLAVLVINQYCMECWRNWPIIRFAIKRLRVQLVAGHWYAVTFGKLFTSMCLHNYAV